MNAGMINPRGCWETTQECVKRGDNTLFSHASIRGAGIMVLQADLQPLSAGWGVYTGGSRGGTRGIVTSVSHKGLHLF